MNSSDILSIVAIVVALLSTAYIYRLSQRAHRVSTYYGVIGLFRDLTRIFIEHPELRPYFYDGKPVDVDDKLRHYKIQAAAEAVLDSFEWIWRRRIELNTKGEDGWRAYIVETFSSSPALQQHYARFSSWYPGITQLIADHSITLMGGVAAEEQRQEPGDSVSDVRDALGEAQTERPEGLEPPQSASG